jgi:hypothetical protein
MPRPFKQPSDGSALRVGGRDSSSFRPAPWLSFRAMASSLPFCVDQTGLPLPHARGPYLAAHEIDLAPLSPRGQEGSACSGPGGSCTRACPRRARRTSMPGLCDGPQSGRCRDRGNQTMPDWGLRVPRRRHAAGTRIRACCRVRDHARPAALLSAAGRGLVAAGPAAMVDPAAGSDPAPTSCWPRASRSPVSIVATWLRSLEPQASVSRS